MNEAKPQTRRPGRPPANAQDRIDIRNVLIRSGLEALTEQGFIASGLDSILKRAGVPKGSFYHYFSSKEAFGHAVLDAYGQYFNRRLDRCLQDPTLLPLQRLVCFAEEAERGLARYGFRRGCLVGNLGQEVEILPESFRERLDAIFDSWESRVAECLQAAQQQGQLPPHVDCQALARFFWIGWEGAVMRARLSRSPQPLRLFIQQFMNSLPN